MSKNSGPNSRQMTKISCLTSRKMTNYSCLDSRIITKKCGLDSRKITKTSIQNPRKKQQEKDSPTEWSEGEEEPVVEVGVLGSVESEQGKISES